MGFLLRVLAVVALIYALSPVREETGAPSSAQVRDMVRRQAERLAAETIERCRSDPARCLAAGRPASP